MKGVVYENYVGSLGNRDLGSGFKCLCGFINEDGLEILVVENVIRSVYKCGCDDLRVIKDLFN